MAFRRRDSGGRAGYSSADAYRSFHNPTTFSVSPSAFNPPSAPSSTGHGHHGGGSSSDEEGIIMPYTPRTPATPNEQTALTQDIGTTSTPPTPTPTRGRASTSSRISPQREESPLSPPRPFFLAATGRKDSDGSSTNRGSWSASSFGGGTDSTPENASDSDVGPVSTPDSSTPNILAASAIRSRARPNPTRERSATQPSPGTTSTGGRVMTRPRNHHRRRSTVDDAPTSATFGGAVIATAAGGLGAGGNPFDTPTSSIYGAPTGVGSIGGGGSSVGHGGSVDGHGRGEIRGATRPPPSAFSFPFQSHPGNPDPGTPIPGMTRRTSQESFRSRPLSSSSMNHPSSFNVGAGIGSVYQSGFTGGGVGGQGVLVNRSASDLRQGDLGRPNPAFMVGAAGGGESPTLPSPSQSQSNLYRSSAAYAMNGDGYSIPRVNSTPQVAMRAPFLSPASRPTSIWSPPSYPSYPPSASLPYLPISGTGSPGPPIPNKVKPPMPSSRLPSKLTIQDKPWLTGKKGGMGRWSWWLTVLMFFIGIGCGGIVIFTQWTGVMFLKDSDLCMVLNEGFDNLDLTNTWVRDVEMSGFGNGEFQMTTDSSDNLYVQNGQLYILPTLTSDEIGTQAIFDGGKYVLDGCTVQNTNASACSAVSSSDGSTIPPVKSARISTQGKYTIGFGKVEVRAKLPRGDWLWPAIWMLPEDDTIYGPWPMGGEIDIMEARGNGPAYTAQGTNFVRSSLNYGILNTLQTHIFGWWSQKQSSYDKDFHIYALEWTPDYMRFYVDSRLQAMMNMKITGKHGESFFDRGKYPPTADNGNGTSVVVSDIWSNAHGTSAAPFDQQFYLILDLAVGGTSGWFPDKIGGKPWFDSSASAMRDFAAAQSTWEQTWPSNANDRAFRIDYVKMWKLGRC